MNDPSVKDILTQSPWLRSMNLRDLYLYILKTQDELDRLARQVAESERRWRRIQSIVEDIRRRTGDEGTLAITLRLINQALDDIGRELA